MTQTREPDDLDRQIRQMNRRLGRLEDTQVSPQEMSRAFDRTYEDIVSVKSEMNARFDRLETEVGELSNKIDPILRHITRMSNS
jgi:uncharacterized protein YceH (UPF0502 family)